MIKRKVLILGEDTRSFLATVRSLARGGLEVHAAPLNFQSPALRSRYITRVHWLPYYLGDGHDWYQGMTELINDNGFCLVIPCDERTLLPLNRHRDDLGQIAALALPSPSCIEVFFDKHKTRSLASSLGIHIAAGGLVSSDSTARALAAEAGLPLAIKPTASYTLDRLYSRGRVAIAHDIPQLERALAEARGQSCLFEAYFEGQGVGVSVLAHEGKVLQAFQHQRVHEIEGASHYRVSAPISPTLLDAVTKLMNATRYTGVAMIEFRVNQSTSAWVLLEINARPWGSLPLPVAIGVDFPYRWFQLLVDGIETSPVDYPVGVFGRNALPDSRYIRLHARRLAKQPISFSRFMLKTVIEYSRILHGHERYDVLVRDDPAPAVYQLGTLFSDYASGRTTSASLTRSRDHRLLRRAAGGRSMEVAVVCQGNICRSPLAAVLLQQQLSTTIPDFKVRSYGNLPRQGNRTPANGCIAAAELGVDLSGHRSAHFSYEAAHRAQLVVVFDEVNRRWIQQRYPDLRAPVVLLGSFSLPPSRCTIADPDGGNLELFRSTYAAIARAIPGLVRALQEAHNGRP